jgi:coronin-7
MRSSTLNFPACTFGGATTTHLLQSPHTNIGTVGILPVGTVGRVGADVHLLNAHGAGLSDWEFSPFDSNVLITGSDNGEVRLPFITQ